jgi:hypothetical protein
MDNILVLGKENKLSLTEEAASIIKDLIKTEEETKKKIEEFKGLIIEEMRERKLKNFESNGVRVSYTAPTQFEDFDKKKFKEEHEDLYNDYVSFKERKDSIKITIKEV